METVEKKNGKPAYTNQSKELFAAFEKASMKTKQLVTAITAAVISSLAVVDVLLLEPPQGSTAGFQLMAVLGTAIAVGAVTFALQQMGINQFNRSAEGLRTMLEALARGEEHVLAQIAGKEWEEVAIAFGQMQEAIAIRVGEAQQKAAAAEKASEKLQQQLIELVDRVEKDRSLASNTEVTARDTQEIEPPGTILEFLENFHQQQIVFPHIKLSSSTPEEIKQHQDRLEYRKLWLQAILSETRRELEFISSISQPPEQKQP